MPKNIRDAIYKRSRTDIFSTPMDVNFFFSSLYLSKDSSAVFWREIAKVKPWQLKDDSNDGEGCKINAKDGKDNNIYDGGGIKLYFITNTEIKVLYFYAPDFYEKQCPGRLGRQGVLKIATLFSKFVKE